MKKFITSLFVGLSVLSLAAVDLRFSWDFNPPEEEISAYKLYEIVSPNTNLLATTAANFAIVPGVTMGKHTYMLTASNLWGESEGIVLSTPVTPNKPLNVKIEKNN